MPGGQAAHDHRHRLQAGVAGDRLDDRHERGQQDHPAQRLVVIVDDDPGAQLDQQRRQDPRQPHERDPPRRAPVELGRVGAGHAEDVLRRLVAHDVHDVLDADRAQQAIGPVHDRQRDQVVLGDDAGHFFLVGLRRHADHVGIGDGANGAGGVGGQQPPQRHHADQVAMGVDREDLEAALLGRHLADVGHRLGDGGGVGDGHDVGRHQAAGRLFGILEELLHLLGLLGLHQVEDRLGLRAGQLLDDVGGPLGRHVVEDARDLLALQRLHEIEQRLIVQLGEDLAGLLAAQQAEEPNPPLLRQLADEPRHVGSVGLRQSRRQLVVAPLVEQLPQRVEEPGALVHVRHYAARSAPASETIRLESQGRYRARESPRRGRYTMQRT